MIKIADIIAALQSGISPDQAVVGAQGGPPREGVPALPVPPQGGDAAAYGAPPPGVQAPVGVRSPVTNPQPPSDSPKVLQSPPDLANMYVTLMKQNQNAQQLDSGLNMVAAGFSKYPENRAALLRNAGGGSSGMSLTPDHLINMQKLAQEQQNALIRKAALPGLMKQYKMTPDQIQYLEAGGKLDEVIKHYSTENLATATDAETGQTHFVNPRTAKIIATIGGEKPDPTQFVAGPNGQELRNMRTNEKVGESVGLQPDNELKDTADGLSLINKNTGAVIAKAIGGAPTPETEKFERPDGSVFLRNKRDGTIEEITPARKPGDKVNEDDDKLSVINREREAKGEPPLSMEQYLKDVKRTPGTTVNIGENGVTFPTPQQGYDYLRTADGKVKIGADGKPQQFAIEGSKAKADEAAAAKTATAADQKIAKNKLQAQFSASNIGKAVDRAFELVDKPGAAGFGSRLARAVSPGGMPSDSMDAAINTINANTAFAALQEMRSNSPTGGALGQVSDFENRMLASTISDLRVHQQPGDLKKGLARVKAAMFLLAEDNFGNDAGKFQTALEAKVDEMLTEQANKTSGGKSVIRRISP